MNFFSFSTLLAAALVLIVASSLLLHPSHGISSDVLSHICSNTTNPKHCQTILKNDPSTTKANLSEFSLITIRMAGAQANFNLLMYLNLVRNTTNESLKKAFQNCVEYYYESETRVTEAYQLSFTGTYDETFDKFSQALNQAHQCAAGIPENNNNSISYVSRPLESFSFLIEISESVIHLLLITNLLG